MLDFTKIFGDQKIWQVMMSSIFQEFIKAKSSVPNAIKSSATISPLNSSTKVNLFKLIPKAMPTSPIATEPPTWPTPETKVIHMVLGTLQFLALLNTINGK